LVAEQLDPTTNESSRKPVHLKTQLERLLAALHGASDIRSVLHPGCGPGLYAAELHRSGVTAYHGIDAGPKVIDHARSLFAGVPGFEFTVGDIRETAYTKQECVDAMLLTYEVANFFPVAELEPMLRVHTRNIRPGGYAVLDMRLRETGTAEFNDGRRGVVTATASLFSAEPHALLVEGFARDEAGITGHRITVVTADRARPPAIFHSILWLYSRPEIGELLDACGLSVQLVEQPFGDQTDPALQAHLVIARKR
jgi:hypothetical protein